MKFFKYPFLLIAAFAFFAISCDNDEDQAKIDDKKINDYLTENNIEATKHSSGLYYKITKEGTGSNPTRYSEVEVRYKGYLTNGTVFDQTGSITATFGIYQTIEGWQLGIPLLKEGGSGIFFIPSGLAYGDRAMNGIPANSVLIFEVDLIDIK